jgi:hypothetical protein
MPSTLHRESCERYSLMTSRQERGSETQTLSVTNVRIGPTHRGRAGCHDDHVCAGLTVVGVSLALRDDPSATLLLTRPATR